MADTAAAAPLPKITYLCSGSNIKGYRIHSSNGFVDLTPSAIKSLARLADVKPEDLVVDNNEEPPPRDDDKQEDQPQKQSSSPPTKAKKRRSVTPRKSSNGSRRESSDAAKEDSSSGRRVTPPAQVKKRVSIQLPTEDLRKKMPRRSATNKVTSYKV